jgi:hypothetical protein
MQCRLVRSRFSAAPFWSRGEKPIASRRSVQLRGFVQSGDDTSLLAKLRLESDISACAVVYSYSRFHLYNRSLPDASIKSGARPDLKGVRNEYTAA